MRLFRSSMIELWARMGRFLASRRASRTLLRRAGAWDSARTVVLTENVEHLPLLARYVAARLRFIEAWSIMQLENIGFAKGRWASLFFDHSNRFAPIGEALDHALLHGLRAQLFNFPRCTILSTVAVLSPQSRTGNEKFAPACDFSRRAKSLLRVL